MILSLSCILFSESLVGFLVFVLWYVLALRCSKSDHGVFMHDLSFLQPQSPQSLQAESFFCCQSCARGLPLETAESLEAWAMHCWTVSRVSVSLKWKNLKSRSREDESEFDYSAFQTPYIGKTMKQAACSAIGHLIHVWHHKPWSWYEPVLPLEHSTLTFICQGGVEGTWYLMWAMTSLRWSFSLSQNQKVSKFLPVISEVLLWFRSHLDLNSDKPDMAHSL